MPSLLLVCDQSELLSSRPSALTSHYTKSLNVSSPPFGSAALPVIIENSEEYRQKDKHSFDMRHN